MNDTINLGRGDEPTPQIFFGYLEVLFSEGGWGNGDWPKKQVSNYRIIKVLYHMRPHALTLNVVPE